MSIRIHPMPLLPGQVRCSCGAWMLRQDAGDYRCQRFFALQRLGYSKKIGKGRR